MSKKQIIFLSCIVISFLGLTFFLLINEKEKKSNYLYLFTGDYAIVRWYYNNNTWYIANTNDKLKDSFEVYSNGKYQGNYNLLFNDKWYYFDKNNESYNFDGNNFMINTSYDFESYEFKTESIDNTSIIKNVSNEIGIKNSDYDAILKQTIIYNNEEFDNMYFIDYYKKNVEFNTLGPSYTVAFREINDKIEVIILLNFEESDKDSCSLDLSGIMKFNNGNNKILLSCIHFDRIPTDYYLYEYSWNKYNLLIEGNGGV